MIKIKTKQKIKHEKSFSMLEVIMSIAIVTIGLVGAMGLLSKSTRESMDSRDQVIAGLLAQEGVEIVRNIRDNNWADRDPSTTSFNNIGTNSNCGVVYSPPNPPNEVPSISCPGSDLLKLNNDNYYSNAGATDTKFRRNLNISSSADSITVISMVIWGTTYPTGGTADTVNCVASNKCAYTTITLSKWGE
jgi:Tfp pilus assembly protein PilV